MSRSKTLEGAAWVKGERTEWSPKVKLLLAFVIGVLVLTPAVLGVYWELFLP
jgi:hypothetical protein